jgi:hypothetical protein
MTIIKTFAKSILFTQLMLCNYTASQEEHLDNSEEYFMSEIVKKIGNFGVNSAYAFEEDPIEVITITHDRMSVSNYYGFLANAMMMSTGGGYRNGCDGYDPYSCEYDTARDNQIDPTRDRACDTVSETRPTTCPDSRPSLAPNGCSDYGLSFSYGQDFAPSCNTHDICYTTMNVTKGACDQILVDDMYDQCYDDEINGLSGPGCTFVISGFYHAVTLFGGSKFKQAQLDRTCVNWHEERSAWGCPV